MISVHQANRAATSRSALRVNNAGSVFAKNGDFALKINWFKLMQIQTALWGKDEKYIGGSFCNAIQQYSRRHSHLKVPHASSDCLTPLSFNEL